MSCLDTRAFSLDHILFVRETVCQANIFATSLCYAIFTEKVLLDSFQESLAYNSLGFPWLFPSRSNVGRRDKWNKSNPLTLRQTGPRCPNEAIYPLHDVPACLSPVTPYLKTEAL